MECTICYEIYDDPTSIIWLYCCHSLCKNCFDKLTQSNCPFCRQSLEENQVQPIQIDNTIVSASLPTILNFPEYDIWEETQQPINNTIISASLPEYDIWDETQQVRHRNRGRNIHRRRHQHRRTILPTVNTIETNQSMVSDNEIFVLEVIDRDLQIDDTALQHFKHNKNNRWNHLNTRQSRYIR